MILDLASAFTSQINAGPLHSLCTSTPWSSPCKSTPSDLHCIYGRPKNGNEDAASSQPQSFIIESNHHDTFAVGSQFPLVRDLDDGTHIYFQKPSVYEECSSHFVNASKSFGEALHGFDPLGSRLVAPSSGDGSTTLVCDDNQFQPKQEKTSSDSTRLFDEGRLQRADHQPATANPESKDTTTQGEPSAV